MRYGREGPVRFLSHLDLVKVFERAIRRTPLKAAYTEGFHPRIRMAFASALPVGAESIGEWLDLDLDPLDPTDSGAAQQILNQALPPGLHILEAREISLPCKSLGGIIGMSVWQFRGAPDADTRIPSTLEASSLPIIRRSQRRDIRPFIERLTPQDDGFEAWIRIEQNGSVKPEELLTAMGYLPEERTGIRATRQALLARSDSGWIAPWG
ncbi:MAG TPA: TIGR03936 family radical SAM-associated protein [Candidatus Xenobia bacterium]|jgi:radical SAM-linked protein